MSRVWSTAAIVVLVVGGAIGWAPSLAEEAPAAPPPPAAEGRDRRVVAERMRELFAARLKAEVGLDDAQVEAVLPKVEAMEQDRARIQRERGATLRALRQGLEAGASDKDLQARLDRLDQLADELEHATGGGLHAIDASLTVPQRVRIRFLLVKFRAEMAQRIRELRQGGGAGFGGRRRFAQRAPELLGSSGP